MTDITGGCACGAIRFRCEGEPRYMGNCHCRDCQQATGSAFFPGMSYGKAAFTLEAGDPKWFARASDAGSEIRRAFCPDCGSPVFLEVDFAPDFIVLYGGALDDPSQFKPQRDIYVKSAQHWDFMNPDLPKIEAMPERRK